ncbi:MAG: flavodoxin [Candidatus Omnitrophota bacterium]|jgi:flavodoxin
MNRPHLVLTITAAFLLIMSVIAETSFAADEAVPLSENKKILVAYFSHSGNTREIAEQIHKIVGGDIFEIQSVEPYPGDYNAVVDQARKELDSGFRPALRTNLENMGSYDIIFIGYPNWWGTFPAPVKTFLTEYDLSGKTIAPFCTHGGSGLGKSVADISSLCPNSTVLEGIAIWGKDVKGAQAIVSEWLQKIKITK